MLTQISSLLAVDCQGILILRDVGADERELAVLAGLWLLLDLRGRFGPHEGLDRDLLDLVHKAFSTRRTEFHERRTVLYVSTQSGAEVVVFLEAPKRLTETDRALVGVLQPSVDRLRQCRSLLAARKGQCRTGAACRRAHRGTSGRQPPARSPMEKGPAGQLFPERSARQGRARPENLPLNVILGRSEILEELLARDAEGPKASRRIFVTSGVRRCV